MKILPPEKGFEAAWKKGDSVAKILFTQPLEEIIFSWTGDEFAVFLTGPDYEHRHEIMEQLTDMCERHCQRGTVVVACGMSEYVKDGDKSLQQVFERADRLMYAEKKRLKERYPNACHPREEV